MLAIIGGALPLVLQIVGWFIGKSQSSDQLKVKFLELVSLYESEKGVSVSLGDSARKQLELLKEELNKDVKT